MVVGRYVLRMRSVVVVGLFLSCGLISCVTTTERLKLPPLATVEHVDLDRYLGTWFEVASFPLWFQAGCTATTATYALRADGEIDVLNRCRKDTVDGDESLAHGRARVVDASTNAKLQVSFFGPFWGDYWIIDLDDAAYAVVGNPSRDALWILSRTRVMSPDVYSAILVRLQQQHYDVTRLITTVQPAE